MRVTGEIRERYGRDEKDLSHVEPPFYKGNSSNDGRDGDVFDERSMMKVKTKMNMKEKELKAEDIPWGYALCFNDACNRKGSCMHYQARLLNVQDRHTGQAVYPTAWQQGECPCYCEKRMVKKAWGFKHLYDNVPKYFKTEARRRVRSYFSAGMGPYYRVYHGENMLTPTQQHDILQILAQYGSTEDIKFDHYETDWDFG